MDSTTTINHPPNESNTNIISHHKSSSSENHRHGGHSIAPPLHSDQKTFKTIYSFPSPRSGRFHEHHHQQQQQPYFLDACYLCKKPLGYNRDIFMYRGDTPFCSEDCRGEQIEIDEDREKKRSFSASIKALRKKEEKEKSSNSSSSPNYTFCSGAVAAA